MNDQNIHNQAESLEFEYDTFVTNLLKETGVEAASAETQQEVRAQLQRQLSLRISSTVASNPSFNQMVLEKPELSFAEAVNLAIEEIDGLAEDVADEVDKLFFELTEANKSFN